MPLVDLTSNVDGQLGVNVEPCYFSSRPRAVRQAFHYSGIANSRHHYTDLPESVSDRYDK